MSNQSKQTTYTPYTAFVDVMSASEKYAKLSESERQRLLEAKWETLPESRKNKFHLLATEWNTKPVDYVLMIQYRGSSEPPQMALVKSVDIPEDALSFALERECRVDFDDGISSLVYEEFKKEEKPSAQWFYELFRYLEQRSYTMYDPYTLKPIETVDDEEARDMGRPPKVVKPTYEVRKYVGHTDADVKIVRVISLTGVE